jgi:hypothetical protein
MLAQIQALHGSDSGLENSDPFASESMADDAALKGIYDSRFVEKPKD